MSKDFFPSHAFGASPPRNRRAKALPQYVEALRAIGESALADFHELSKGFIPMRSGERKQPNG